jgi:hypothetical protein
MGGRNQSERLVAISRYAQADREAAIIPLDDQVEQLRVLLFRGKPLIELGALIAGFAAKCLGTLRHA